MKLIKFDDKHQKKFFENIEVWLSTKDVAKFLSLSPNAVRIMVCRGKIPAFQIGGRLRFRKNDCVSLLSKKGE